MKQPRTSPDPHRRFAELLSQEGRYMTRICACFLPGDAEGQREMMQAVSSQLYEVLLARGGEMTAAYARGVWQNLCKQHYNRLRRHLTLSAPLPESLADSTAEEAEEEPLMARLSALLACLSDEERALMMLYTQAGSMAEVAEELGTSVGSAKTRVHRVVEKMRKMKNELI